MTLPDCAQFGPHDCAVHAPCQNHSRAGYRLLEASDLFDAMGFPDEAREYFTDAGGSGARLTELTPITTDAFRRVFAVYLPEPVTTFEHAVANRPQAGDL